ncbi:RICIN domain-containing protein [Actinopolyspora mortivallis]|uniref:RICIN domain-containing protein n=1 Tax=Actinopolyspora mortivallis TaxID=33906 RepID=UPI0021599FD7|nr:RICIN domain-containing protein [Actinopolyspora mortivallis]
MTLRKRIALMLAATLSLAAAFGTGAGATEQHTRHQEESRAQSSVILREPYHLYNRSANLFMLAKGWNSVENGLVDLWYQHNTGEPALREQWKFLPTGVSGVARIKNVGSGLCLQPNPDRLDPFRHVVQKRCDKGEREQWWNLQEDNGLRISSFTNDNRVLTPYNGAQASHDIVLDQDTGSSAQRWRPVLVD